MYRLNKDKPVNAELIQALVSHFRVNHVSKLARLERYYKGNHDINQRVFDDPSKPNNKIVNPYPKYITDIATGYFMGSPVKYSSEDEDYMIRLQDIIDNNADSTHNMELAKQVSIYGVGYEFIYMNEVAEIKYTILDSKSTFVAYDNSVEEKPLLAVRILSELDYITGETISLYEVYTKDEVIHYSEEDGALVETDRVIHYFGDVPIIEYRNNAERLGDFESVLSLVDAYDGAVSDTANEINYFSDAYLKLSGMEDTDPEDIQKMKQMRVLLMPEGGDASFIVKQSDYESIEAFKNRLREDIHKFSMTPDLTDTNFAQNASGVAMRFKVLGLDNVTVNKENMFKGALAQRMKLITTIMNIKGGNYDFNDVYFTFIRNLPQDNEALIKNAKEMLGLVSHETALSTLPSNIVDDTAYEMKQIQDEKTNSIYGTLEDI